MTRVLVTGANGFVGRHVCRRFLDAGWQVRGTVRSSGARSMLPKGVEPHEIESIENSNDWQRALGGVDVVVHLIARTHVLEDDAEDPLQEYRRINVEGTKQLLQACGDSSVQRFLFMSSIKAVGEGADRPYRESDPCEPEDGYGFSKREAEQLVTRFSLQTGIESVIIRPPLVYGPDVRGNFARLAKAVARGVPMPLGCVTKTRSMIFVDNLADATFVCATHPAAANELFHVADAEPISSRKLVQLLAASFDRPARLIPVPVPMLKWCGLLIGRSAEIERLVGTLTVSTDTIERLICWRPQISTDEGIRRSVAHLRTVNSRTSDAEFAGFDPASAEPPRSRAA